MKHKEAKAYKLTLINLVVYVISMQLWLTNGKDKYNLKLGKACHTNKVKRLGVNMDILF